MVVNESGTKAIKILVSVDIEGVAGVVDWDDTLPGAPDYATARRLMTNEANAAIRGVLNHAPSAEVVVADAHARLRNLLPDALDRRARLVRGLPRPDLMLTGIDDHVDAVLMVGYHGKAGAEGAVLAHTLNGAVIQDVRCDGRSLGEIGLNAAYAAVHGAAPVLVTGDDRAGAEARDVAPGIHAVAVKRALGVWAAESMHPDEACERIEAAVPAALAAASEVRPPRFEGPVDLELDLVHPAMAEALLRVPGVERRGGRGVRFDAPDFTTAYRLVELVAMLSPGLRGDR
ncbi:M55 family metallopeptidase [Baekduia sp.]|uniref:M55 family metallopeptidase n=1 Tax=Baekduia sp. TaxID=2600305 RepID=UPI002D780400|nr:M55 family metallopeptidase [Baekduia sp.]